MKKLVDEPGVVVDEMLDGMIAAHPELRRLDGTNALVRDDVLAEGKVAVVSGDGSGHEPARADYLSEGMLNGAAAGEVFTSPTADQLNEMIQAASAGEGILCVIRNYEGDVVDFGTAAEMTGMEGVDVKQIIVNDNMTVEGSLYTSGRRGVAGTIFVHKYAGTKAAAGDDLDEVTTIAEKVVDNIRTMGVALTSCVTPEKGESAFSFDEDEIEPSIGIHGEPDTERAGIMSTDEITEHLTKSVLDDLGLGEGKGVVTMVNGMDGTSLPELYIVNRKFQSTLDDHGVETWDTWVDDYMTSLDMMGCSVSALRVDDELKELLGAPAGTPGLTITE